MNSNVNNVLTVVCDEKQHNIDSDFVSEDVSSSPDTVRTISEHHDDEHQPGNINELMAANDETKPHENNRQSESDSESNTSMDSQQNDRTSTGHWRKYTTKEQYLSDELRA
ncbi:unnamed protein product, partial [Oppiella nova]